MLQRVLYDQLNPLSLDVHTRQIIFLYPTETTIVSPYGPLQLNPHSHEISKAASQSYIADLQADGKDAHRISCTSYAQGLLTRCQTHAITTVSVMIPSEPSLYASLQKNALTRRTHGIEIERLPNTQFLISHDEFIRQYPTKPPVMETFYRWMRKKFDILMQDGKPTWWERNYDKDNRKFDKKYTPRGEKIIYPTSRQQALETLNDFITHKLDRFGELEDAMYTEDDLGHHSLLSTAINFGLLTPLEVIKAIESADTAINNKEWFIRQILGWREYMYHRFWYYKDTIYTTNALNHTKKLPDRFRRPDHSPLQMRCINRVLTMVKNTWYSHHIIRLMIIGNFTLLMGYNPHDVNKRFWEMYADAFERVVTPNVLGMSQFADGGNLATKPYISSANYINNMSDYCKSCAYDPKIKEWPKACPMNYLYRNFVDRHRDLFARQPYIVSNLNKVDIELIRKQAKEFIESMV